MGITLIFVSLLEVTKVGSCTKLLDSECSLEFPGNSSSVWTVPQTDTGGLVEYTKAWRE
jgi:hypothetical protein